MGIITSSFLPQPQSLAQSEYPHFTLEEAHESLLCTVRLNASIVVLPIQLGELRHHHLIVQ